MQEKIRAKKFYDLLIKIRNEMKVNYLKLGNLTEVSWPMEHTCSENLDYYKYNKFNLSTKDGIFSDKKIDVIIPTIEKDISTLPFVIDSVFQYIKHPIGRILIISPVSKKILDICSIKNCQFVHEDSLLPITRKEIHYRVNGLDRSGWLFQQLLKLAADSLSKEKYYLVLDADTIFIRPQVFEINEKVILLHSDEHHQAYFDLFYKLFGRRTGSSLSFVCHHMLFEKKKIVEFKKELETKNAGMIWYNVLLSKIDRSNISAMSEFELYGQWMLLNYPETLIREYWFNKAFSVKMLQELNTLKAELSTEYRSLSFHSYMD